MTRRRPAAAAGFTLIEVMLALALMAFITSLIWGAFSQTVRVKKRIESAQERTHTVRLALMRMTREIEMAYLSAFEAMGVQDRRTFFTGITHTDVDEMSFSWFGHQRLRADVPEGDTSLIAYFGAPDPDDSRVVNLMRRETSRLEAKKPELIPGAAYILCPDVARVKFSYWDFRAKEWRDEWDTTQANGYTFPPTQVKIALTVIDERDQAITFTSIARVHTTERVDYRPGRS
jgi:general secretion pathway protein J